MKLHIPAQIKPTRDAFISQPEKFREWLDALSESELGEKTRNIFHAICEHNKLMIPDTDRLENLEQLRQPLRQIFDNLKKHFINKTHPLTDKTQQIVNLNQSLLREVSIGYKIVINNIANNTAINSNTNKETQRLGVAISRAIRYQSELLLRASEIYAKSPTGTWLDLHTIYDFADKMSINKDLIADNEYHSGSASIEDYYKQVLLFALARPIGLRQQDTEKLYLKLADWSNHTHLHNGTNEKDVNRIFCIKINDDSPPSYLKKEDCEDKYPVRTLDASTLSEALQYEIANMDTEHHATEYTLPVETLQVLVFSWGVYAKRKYTRCSHAGYIPVVIGFIDASKAIKNEAAISKASDPLYEENLQTARSQLNTSLTLLSKYKDYKTYNHGSEAQDRFIESATDEVIIQQPSNITDESIASTQTDNINRDWEIVNVSAGGYCLRWNSDETSKAQIGEVIALCERKSDGTSHWRIGAIRWMQYTREHGLEIGVQLLSPNVCSATIKRINSPERSSLDCMVLPGINPLKLAASILLPTQSFKVDDCLKFKALGQDMEIKLCAITERTGSFSQFVFSKTDAPVKVRYSDSDLLPEESDDFADIWSSL